MIAQRQILWVALASACFGGCVPAEVDPDAGTETCVPDTITYQNEALPLIESYCAECHTSPPQGGAPFPLTTYEAILAPYFDERVVDAIPRVLENNRMPPLGHPQPSKAQRQRLIDWATCDARSAATQ